MSPRLLAAGALALGLVGLGVYGAHQVARVGEMRREIEATERDIATLRQRTEELGRTVERLRSDPAYVEKLAREELGYVRPGETILKFPSPPK
ncbi:MAG TPA: septum formation initiator family protein [Candidatus Tectomicrobia bacterium]|nr:septum formation initiator family protein [Candidatus Tectomicrobia bacterium]